MGCNSCAKWAETLRSIDAGMESLASGVSSVSVDGTTTTFTKTSELIEYRQYAERQASKAAGNRSVVSSLNMRSAWG